MSGDSNKTGRPGAAAPAERPGLRLADVPAARALRDAVFARLSDSDRDALAAAATRWTLGGRAAPGAVFGDGVTALVAGGLAESIRDFGAAAPRPCGPEDTAALCRLADALPGVAAIEPPPAAGDAAPARRRLQALAVAFAASGKHIVAAAADSDEVRDIARMARAVAAPTERPPAALVTVAALPGERCLETALTAAAEGLPCLVAVPPGFLAEPDAVGAAAEPLAVALDVAAAVATAAPGAAVGLAVPPAPAAPLAAGGLAALVAVTQTVHALGLPLAVTALAAHSTAPDWLAATENTSAALAGGVAGLDALTGAGLLDGGLSLSLEQLALAAEIHSYAGATVAGFAVDDETLALETVKDVGIGGNYLGQRHTRRHMRGVWRTRLFDRTPYEQWQREGRRQSPELAAELVRAILADHEPAPLDRAVAAELDRIALGKEPS